MERKFKGIWIPSQIWLSDDINMQQKAMLGEIDSYKEYFASNAHLAKKMGLSIPRVKALLSDLRKKDWIKQKEERKGNLTVKRTIWINSVKIHRIENDTNSIDGIENDTKFVSDLIRGGIGSDTHTNKVTNKVTNKDNTQQAAITHESFRDLFNNIKNNTNANWCKLMIVNDERKARIKKLITFAKQRIKETPLKKDEKPETTAEYLERLLTLMGEDEFYGGKKPSAAHPYGYKWNFIDLTSQKNIVKFIEATA
jgi:hypothetical protein